MLASHLDSVVMVSVTRRMVVSATAVLVLAACGGDASGGAAPLTSDEASRPLSDGRQRTETFLDPAGNTAELPDDESAPDDGPDGTSDADTSADASSTELEQPGTGDPTEPVEKDPFAATKKAFARFAAGANAATAVSLTIVRESEPVFRRAVGEDQNGREATPDSPMAVSGVSKLITALAIGRLEQEGLLDMSAPVPWADMGLVTHGKWSPITIRELIDQTGGMPAKNNVWKSSVDDCAANLTSMLSARPAAKRQGIRTDANGNGCLLGLVIEHVTGESLDVAVQRLVFAPAGVDGFHTTADGLRDDDVGLLNDQLLTSTGGAGTFVASSDDLTAVFSSLTADDLEVFDGSSVMNDQYGWGHTGIAKDVSSCLWILEDGKTVMAATAVGDTITGGVACDRFVPAVATDLELGLGSAKPDRNK